MRTTNTHFESHGYQYHVDSFGTIHQLNPEPFTYDAEYNSTYDTPEYTRNSEVLQALRLGFISGVFGNVGSIIDYGCGNGAFCKFATKHIPEVYGYDVDLTPIDGVLKMDYLGGADLYTFHDSLEHVPDLSFIANVPAQKAVVSLPWCHYKDQGQAWFDHKYKHRKPNEHLHHFDELSLLVTMADYGWTYIQTSNHEDIIRKSAHGLPNILTMAFVRK